MEQNWKYYKNKIFDSDPLFNYRCLKSNISSYNSRVTTNFNNVSNNNDNNKVPKEGFKCICLWLRVTDVGNINFLQTCPEKCKAK